VVYPVEAIEDIIDAARFIAPEDPAGVVLVGLCSGATTSWKARCHWTLVVHGSSTWDCLWSRQS